MEQRDRIGDGVREVVEKIILSEFKSTIGSFDHVKLPGFLYLSQCQQLALETNQLQEMS